MIGKLLKGKNNGSLINYLKSNIVIEEFDLLLRLFLVNRISLKIVENYPYDKEDSLLKIVDK